ncbi:IS3 family transposase [Pseudonocardia nigra]|uniref:IS3 family transposase n=1 Tax=Pseudonocardia nigra TaxID=1921578 RepID=UPI001C5D65CA
MKSARAEENELLLKHIEKIHQDSRGTYGWPRVHAELTLGLGLAVNHKRVARLMRAAGIQGLYGRRRHGCTVRDPHAEPYVDLVDRDFVVDGPNELWCTDIPNTRPWKGRYTAQRSSTSIHDESSDGQSTTTCAPHSSTRSAWPSPPGSRVQFGDPALRPRIAVHVLGVRATTPQRRPRWIDGLGRRFPLNRPMPTFPLLSDTP